MANINNAKRAGFLKEARKRASWLSRRESLYLEALEAFLQRGCQRQGQTSRLVAGTRDDRPGVSWRHRCPAWLAMVTWQNAMDGIGSRQAVDTLLDTVLQVEPMHPGAHHYRIHLWDGPSRLVREIGRALTPRPRRGSHTPGTCRATPIRD